MFAPVLTYFHPTIDPHPTQKISATVCIPVIINLSSILPEETFTLKRKNPTMRTESTT